MAFAAINFLVEMAFPTVAMALTAGAGSPEFSSFEPVATTDMVNDFTGDFTYNLPVLSVPGPDGGGYSMSLSYHSGGSSEEEASWVGHGWTLNPGAINRQKRGFADDFHDVEVINYNKTTPNWTQSSAFNFNLEIQSSDEKEKEDGDDPDPKEAEAAQKKEKNDTKNGKEPTKLFLGGTDPYQTDVSFSFSKSIRYNNYSGYSITSSFGANTSMGSLNMNRSAGETTLGFSINPIGILDGISKIKKNKEKKDLKFPKLAKFNDAIKKLQRVSLSKRTTYNTNLATSYSSFSFNAPSVPYSVTKSSGKAYNWSASLQINPAIPVGFQVGIRGSINSQIPESKVINQAYGYMYNPTITGANVLSDYQLEKPSTFNKHDQNLGIPYNNADVFTATGNGVVGGFKIMHNQIGHYHPPYVRNKQKIRQLGVEIGVGGTLQVGFDFGLGFQETNVGDWRVVEDDIEFEEHNPSTIAVEKPYMRFNGDMGGEVDYSGNGSELLAANVGGSYLNRKLDLGNFDQDGVSRGKAQMDRNKEGRTSFIEYETLGGLITGMVVTNKDGNKSKYSEPVYVYEETELTIGLKDDITLETGTLKAIINDDDATPAQYVVHHPLRFDDPIRDNKTAVGQRIEEEKYASTYLLTENTTFDYIDLLDDGPTEDDFGGWTKFEYRTPHTDYRYRAPYTGLFYSRGRLFDGDDQTGSMSSGIKEVKYLKSIETKTHIAFFITNNTTANDFIPDLPIEYANAGIDFEGSPTTRPDGLDAEAIGADGLDYAAKPDLTSNLSGKDGKGEHDLDQLEKIVLYAKNDLDQPISTTYFEYDNTLVQGVPNTNGSGNNSGKLTLKKVWTESGGTIKSKIAPYQFDYEYFTNYPQVVKDKYEFILDDNEDLSDGEYYKLLTKGDGTSSISDQNPVYQEGQLDMFGNYRIDGKERFENMQPWVNQQENDPHFDPAAWQLKRIILPSGGEIHVQYEQKDYSFVQDKGAMVMTNLIDHDDFNNGYETLNLFDLTGNKIINPDANKYFIDLQSVGVNPADSDEVNTYLAALRTHFVTLKNKLYYKILYSYRANYKPNLHHFNHRYDYVNGYTSVSAVEQGANGIGIYLTLGSESGEDKTLPRYVGFQKLHQQADRNLGWDAKNLENDDRAILASAYGLDGESTEDIGTKGVDNIFQLFADWADGDIKNYPQDKACKVLNFDLSYFKLPAFKAKKGGGIRVKRLLSYDPGIVGETGDAMVFGSEYIYRRADGTTSGVATNEPQQGREESPLTTILERNKQSGWNKMLNGRDSKTAEGPIGESLLPGASIVHERVVIKNIHSGKTTTGYAVNEYHTTREFPMEVDYTELSKKGDDPTYKKFNLDLPLGLFNMSVNKAWVTQGYLFKLNDMHGKPKSQATYAGNYNGHTFNEATATSKTTYTYTNPGTPIRSLVYDPGSHDFTYGVMSPGQEEDLTMYRSKVTDRTNDFSLELDLNITLPIFINLGFGLTYNYTDNQLSQHVTSKVVRQKAYLLSTTTSTDGVTQTTENLAFDKYTGDPVLTRTYDGYFAVDEKINTEVGAQHDGQYYALNIPASWVYEEMGQKSKASGNIPVVDLVNNAHSNQLTASVGNIVTYGENALVANAVGASGTIDALTTPFNNVVNASATVYKKDWFTSSNPNQATLEAEYPAMAANNTELNKHYYPQRTYVYRDQVTNANDADRIYGGGVITDPLTIFDWNAISSGSVLPTSVPDFDGNGITNEKWYSASEIVSYSPQGYPLEEKDVLDINSTARFGYNKTLPTLVAQNAAYSEVKFTDFEFGMDPATITAINTNYAHSGSRSFDLRLDNNYVFANAYQISPEMITDNKKGLTIKLWLKSSLSQLASSPNFGLKNPNPGLVAKIGGQQFNFKRIAQTGEWSLYEVDINNFNGLSDGLYNVQLGYNFLPGEMVLIDDFRMQPLDAVMNCTVYTKDNKVAAQFDDQHFGVFYEYNNKGQLVRKSIETERGQKTLQEQQYGTPLKYRSN